MIITEQKVFTTIFLVVLGLLIPSTCIAQSTVYVFAPKLMNVEGGLKINGKNVGELKGPLQKTIKPVEPMKIAAKVYSPCVKKCILKDEGKTLFTAEYEYTNYMNLSVSNYACEIQLNLSEGSIHYISIKQKGFGDMQFKEITEKEAQKLLKKNVALPDYIEE
jgi:hypothetical protein